MLVLDSGALSRLSEQTKHSAALISELRGKGLWPPLVPSVVLVECLTGDSRRDANANRLIKTCDVAEETPESLARRAARLRTLAKRGSAVDAIVVATAEPNDVVLTSDLSDLRALALHADRVWVDRI